MAKLFLLLIVAQMLICIEEVTSYQCKMITVPYCDNDEGFNQPGHGMSMKGDKGDVGLSGKKGPKGQKGDSSQLKGMEDFKQEVKSLIQEMNSTLIQVLAELSAKLDNVGGLQKEKPVTPRSTVSSCSETSIDGVYSLTSGKEVHCSDGWTTIQRRTDGSLRDFHLKTWEDYAKGFGKVTGEHWLGLRTLRNLTHRGDCRLRAEITNYDNEAAYAEYRRFAISSEEDHFTLTISGYNGTAGDALRHNNYNSFTTIDRDNDILHDNCAAPPRNLGGWWHNNCGWTFPNAIWGRTSNTWDAMIWYQWKKLESLKTTHLKFRCD